MQLDPNINDNLKVNLSPKASGYISITHGSTELFKKNIGSFQEVKEFTKQYGKSASGGFLQGTFIPLRTDSWEDFAKDLFFPNFINHALKVDRIGLRILISPLALALDIVTFISRLIASPFRITYNNTQNEHPLINLIKDHPESAQAIKSGIVKIYFHFESIEIDDKTAKEEIIQGYMTVTIKSLPKIKDKEKIDGKIIKYQEIEKGEWNETYADTRHFLSISTY